MLSRLDTMAKNRLNMKMQAAIVAMEARENILLR